MRFSVQVIAQDEGDGTEPTGIEVLAIERVELSAGTVGLKLEEAKAMLAAVQRTIVERQVGSAIAARACCPDCGRRHRHKDMRAITLRSLFGTLHLQSPRWWRCGCHPAPGRTFQPLAELLTERAMPELTFLETRFAGLASYGITARLLGELLPLGRKVHAETVRRAVHAVAGRLEDELGEERLSFIDTCQYDRGQLPHPELPIVVGLDGGYIHSSRQTSRTDGWFEAIAGKVMPDSGKATCFAYVQSYDTKPKRRVFEALNAQGMAANQPVTFLSDGGEDIRYIPTFINAQAEHLLDWFHITMRITVMANMAKSLKPRPPHPEGPDDEPPVDLAADVATELTRLKWFLWHGNVYRALDTIETIIFDLDDEHPPPQQARLLKAVQEFHTYIQSNTNRIPNYGERYRSGEAISTAPAESAVNQIIAKRMVKKQQMRWTPEGAHLLLQIRTHILNDQLANDFHRWYPGLTDTENSVELAA